MQEPFAAPKTAPSGKNPENRASMAPPDENYRRTGDRARRLSQGWIVVFVHRASVSTEHVLLLGSLSLGVVSETGGARATSRCTPS